MIRPKVMPRMPLIALWVLVWLAVGAGPALAGHDPDFIHVCLKNGSLQVVGSAADCKENEIAFALATEAALESLQSANAGLQAQLDALRTLVGRLHGTVAVFDRTGSGIPISSPGMPGGFRIELSFCDPDDLQPLDDCDSDHGLTLDSGLITAAQNNGIITFDATNSPDFPLIVDRLTNGENDILTVFNSYEDSNGAFVGGGSSQGTERAWFFDTTQVTSDPDFVDLSGLQIDSITIALDFVLLFYNQTTQMTERSLSYRVFFGMADPVSATSVQVRRQLRSVHRER